jgi:hypothetical protein
MFKQKKSRLSIRRRRYKDSKLWNWMSDRADQFPLKSHTAGASQRQANSARQLLTAILS